MRLIYTKIKDLCILEPKVFNDDRGYFLETYNEKRLKNLIGIKYKFIQENESKSGYGVIRGLHYQLEPYSQAKLVRVIAGKVYDVALDLRKNSPTFGKWLGIELSSENKKQLLIPKGFAHGFSVLSKTAIFAYKCDEYYHPEAERGIFYKDSKLRIDWKIKENEKTLSKKDKLLPEMKSAEMNFEYKK
ncbi:MAG: dTDP-4-dehydrorhamnose 3,5-epimerase [Methanosarcinaceae archaeon]|nr:dTDP-4-dehydrorhamnose 3,5-epimerase [Methanosarcinaceae archaeon]MDD4331642.1 dTDP-4-dehydrorhamnose 3,5-epimerase [Methanosarcinaceae archaeon]MDD4748479.1 dTDP-4-dehydrorhamnose 3,5-epimerase [Methanosarcinaceae archaeon]